MSNPPEAFFLDREALEGWISSNPTVAVDAHGIEAPGSDLSGLKLVGADFTAANLDGACLDGADLSGASFKTTRLRETSFRDAKLADASFELAKLDGASLEGARGTGGLNLQSARLKDVRAGGLNLERANLQGAYLEAAQLKKTKLAYANLEGANLIRADLTGSSLYGAELTNTTWREVRLDKTTNLSVTVFRPQHDSPNDRSDTLKLSKGQRALSWTSIRFLGDIPLFSGSYAVLVLTLLGVSAIEWLNANPFVESFYYPIPVPRASRLLLVGSALLAIGTTVFEIACPARVKEFSRVRWVEELGRPGVLYTWEALKYPLATVVTATLVAGGGALVAFVFLERLFQAVWFAFGSLS